MIGECQLCKSDGITLRASHIIPESCYKRIYTSKHKFQPLSAQNSEAIKLEQKGYREYLFCQSCETRLSVWEKYLSECFDELITGQYRKLGVDKISKFTVLRNYNYDYLKRAILSIFWRMSISSLPFFDNYSFPKHEEAIRQSLVSESDIHDDFYPVIVYKGLLNGKFEPGLMVTIDESTFSDAAMYSLVLNGFLIDIVMSDTSRVYDELTNFKLKKSETMIFMEKNFNELDLPLQHFMTDENKDRLDNFFSKHN